MSFIRHLKTLKHNFNKFYDSGNIFFAGGFVGSTIGYSYGHKLFYNNLKQDDRTFLKYAGLTSAGTIYGFVWGTMISPILIPLLPLWIMNYPIYKYCNIQYDDAFIENILNKTD